MFCAHCKKILDLDILLETAQWHETYKADEGRQKLYPHHESFAALARSAAEGCDLCKLVFKSVNSLSISYLQSLSGEDAQLFFQLFCEDKLEFTTRSLECTPSEDSLFHGIQLSMSEGDPASQIMPPLLRTKLLAPDVRSRSCFDLAKYWLRTCLSEHTNGCTSDQWPLPTRVIDVGSLYDGKVKLHLPIGEVGHWIVLSHCWGGKSASATTVDNLDVRCHGFPVSELPRTFRDAVLITRRLSYKYLWIDCLCIIQDSDEDRRKESIKMVEIYSHGILTISADAAVDSEHGIFGSANTVKGSKLPKYSSKHALFLKLPVHSAAYDISTTLYARRERAHSCADDVSILQQRAWAFQETVLSRRRLRYTPYGILWSCVTKPDFYDEQWPHFIQETNDLNQLDPVFRISDQRIPPDCSVAESPDAQRALDWWYRQINEYAGRQLTFERDRLPSLSGLAQEFALRTGYRYRAGIWAKTSDGVCFGAASEVESKSWTSCVCFSTFKKWDFLDGRQVELVRFDVENVNGNAFGQIISAKVYLRGLCQNFRTIFLAEVMSILDNPGDSYISVGRTISYFKSPTEIKVFLDFKAQTLERFHERDSVHVLQIARLKCPHMEFMAVPGSDSDSYQPFREATFGLMLELVDDHESTYRKVGIISIPVSITERLGAVFSDYRVTYIQPERRF